MTKRKPAPLLNALMKTLHPPLPLNRRQSRLLLQSVINSFGKHLDVNHPTSETPTTSKAASSSSQQPPSVFHVADSHFHSLMTNPLMSLASDAEFSTDKPKSASMSSRAASAAKDANLPVGLLQEKFNTIHRQMSGGIVDLPLIKAYLCESARNLRGKETADVLPVVQIYKWLRQSYPAHLRELCESPPVITLWARLLAYEHPYKTTSLIKSSAPVLGEKKTIKLLKALTIQYNWHIDPNRALQTVKYAQAHGISSTIIRRTFTVPLVYQMLKSDPPIEQHRYVKLKQILTKFGDPQMLALLAIYDPANPTPEPSLRKITCEQLSSWYLACRPGLREPKEPLNQRLDVTGAPFYRLARILIDMKRYQDAALVFGSIGSSLERYIKTFGHMTITRANLAPKPQSECRDLVPA